jgi:hypothetical protein
MIKAKKWYWWFTIFASPTVTTTIYPNIYLSQGFYKLSKRSQNQIIKHEKIHLKQQEDTGLLLYLLLYCLCFPLFYNPWRYKWEIDAYMESGVSIEQAKINLGLWNYGWLKK